MIKRFLKLLRRFAPFGWFEYQSRTHLHVQNVSEPLVNEYCSSERWEKQVWCRGTIHFQKPVMYLQGFVFIRHFFSMLVWSLSLRVGIYEPPHCCMQVLNEEEEERQLQGRHPGIWRCILLLHCPSMTSNEWLNGRTPYSIQLLMSRTVQLIFSSLNTYYELNFFSFYF